MMEAQGRLRNQPPVGSNAPPMFSPSAGLFVLDNAINGGAHMQ
jgi:hypothetical protein